MDIRAAEISAIIKDQIANFGTEADGQTKEMHALPAVQVSTLAARHERAFQAAKAATSGTW